MTWTSRYSEKWPRLTALFHLDNGIDTEIHENGRYETTFQETNSEPFYKLYLHPDDIGRGRSVSQYSIQNAGRATAKVSKSCNIRVFLGTVLLFSLAGVVAVAVTLAVLLSQPHASSHSPTKHEDEAFSKEFLSKKEKVLSNELCGLMKDMFKLDANENRPVQDCSVSLLIQDGHMKVNFKVPATDKLMQEEIEKIKKNVLKNIKDLDIGLGVISNTDDVSIHKKDDKELTTVEIILTTTKPLFGVTHATSHDAITKKDTEKVKMETVDDGKKPEVTGTQISTTESTDYTQANDTTTLSPDSTTEQKTQKTTGPLPDHTSIDDVPFLSQLNKTVKDLIQDFHSEFEVTKEPFMDHDHLLSDFEHIKQHLNGMGHTRMQFVTSTTKPLTDNNESLVTSSEGHQHFDLNLDANDTFDFTGLQLPPGNSSFKENTLNVDTLMIDNPNVTESPNAFRFLNSSTFTNAIDNVTNIDDSPKVGNSNSSNDLNKEINFNNTWKSNGKTTSKYSMDESNTKPTTATSISLERSTPIVTSKDISTVSAYKSEALTTPSLQNLYQDFLWNFGPRISTTSKPDISFHDHAAHSSPHTEYQHSETHGLSYSPMEVKTETIGPELTLNAHSHFNFHGLSLDPNKTSNGTNIGYDTTHFHNHDETVPHDHFSFPTSLPVTPISTNEILKGLEVSFDGPSYNSNVSQDQNGTLISTIDSLNQARDPKKENKDTEKEHTMRESNSSDLYSLVTPSLSSTYMVFESPFSTRQWNKSTISTSFSSEILLSNTIQLERVLSTISAKPMDASHLLTQKEDILFPKSDTSSIRPQSSYRTKYEQSKSSDQVKPSLIKNTQFVGILNGVSEHTKEPTPSTHDKPTVYSTTPLIHSSSTVLFEDLPISSKSFVPDDISFPQHLSFPEQRLVDHTLLKLPEMSVQPTLDASLPINHYESNQLHALGAETQSAKSLDTQLQSDLKRQLGNTPFVSSHSKRLVSSFGRPLDFDKTSVISPFTALSENASVSFQISKAYDISKNSIYFPYNYDITNDSDLFSLRNLSPEMFSNHLTDNNTGINISAYPDAVHLSTSNLPVSSQIMSNELSSLPFHKPVFTQELKSVQYKGMGHSSSGKWIRPTKTVLDPSSATLREIVKEGALSDILKSSSRIKVIETYAPTLTSLSSSIFVENVKEPGSDIALEKKNPSSHDYPVDITFPDQPWVINEDISSMTLYTTLLSNNFLESSMANSLSSKTYVSSHMSQDDSDIYKMLQSSPTATMTFSSSYMEPNHIGSSYVEPFYTKEIGVFETNLPWDALDIKPTKTSLSDNMPSRDDGQRKHQGKLSGLSPSRSSDTGTGIHHQTPAISVYTVTHEPIVYLTIDTRPVMDSSLLIQPTPRVSMQATFFRDRKKLENLPIQGRRGVLKVKRGSGTSNSKISALQLPTKVDVTTSRPQLTSVQVAGIKRRLARLRAARMQNFRRRQNSFPRMQSRITDNFPLRRQISGSNTATTLVGRGLNVNNSGRRSQQQPTAPSRTAGTTDNPRQRIDRDRLFPGFSADNQFNRNFFNNIRWNG